MCTAGARTLRTSWNSTTLRNFSLQKIKSPFWLTLTQSGFYYFQLKNFKHSTKEKKEGHRACLPGVGKCERPNLGVLARFNISQWE